MLAEALAERAAAQLKARNAEAEAHALALQVEQMKFTIAKLRHERYGQSSERSAFLEQFELKLADLEENASEAEAAAQMAAAAAAEQKIAVKPFERNNLAAGVFASRQRPVPIRANRGYSSEQTLRRVPQEPSTRRQSLPKPQ